MLKSLSVQNYALIDSLELDLSDSLNIITGETGAGKSILLGALGLLMGARAEAGVVRDESRNCVVEGVFELDGEEIVIRRVVAAGGKSRSFLDDMPVQQTELKELSLRLLDIHSQHQSLLLTEDSFRTGIVDSAAGSVALAKEYRAAYDEWRSAERELVELESVSAKDREEKEWLEHQVGELLEAKLKDGEAEELEVEQVELTHAEEIKSVLGANAARLDGEDMSIVAEMKYGFQTISALGKYYPRAGEFAERFNSSMIELRDLEQELAKETDRIEVNPARLEMVEERLSMIYSLLKKHRAETIAELLEIQAGYEDKLLKINTSDDAIEALRRRVEALHEDAEKMAAKLSAMRKKAAGGISTHVEETAAELGMPAAKFVVEISPTALKPAGADDIKFMFSANKNVAPAPIEKVASGGELSRIMLAIKALAARNANLPTIIFDEIDTGVSGSIADAMGRIIEQLGVGMQVVNITHLPQVASKGDTHFVVYKDDESHTLIRRLSSEERVEEIAKMLSGKAVTAAAREQAKELLGR